MNSGKCYKNINCYCMQRRRDNKAHSIVYGKRVFGAVKRIFRKWSRKLHWRQCTGLFGEKIRLLENLWKRNRTEIEGKKNPRKHMFQSVLKKHGLKFKSVEKPSSCDIGNDLFLTSVGKYRLCSFSLKKITYHFFKIIILLLSVILCQSSMFKVLEIKRIWFWEVVYISCTLSRDQGVGFFIF